MRIQRLFATLAISACFAMPAGAAPWSADPSWRVEQHEITVPADGIELSGTLHAPKGASNVPVVVALHGSSAGGQNDPLYAHLHELLPALGIAVFTFDRRGTGDANAERPHFSVLADDAIAAKRAVAVSDLVDADRVGFWGLSQGGWIAMKAAAGSTPAFVVIASTPLVSTPEQMIFVSRNAILLDGHGEAAADLSEATRRTIDDFIRGERTRAEAVAAIEAVREKPWYPLTFLGVDDPEAQIRDDYSDSSWAAKLDVDYEAILTQIDAPTLLLLGTMDTVVPVQHTLDRLAVMPNSGTRDVVVIPDADHVLRIVDEPSVGGDPEEAIPDSAVYFAVLGHWLGQTIH